MEFQDIKRICSRRIIELFGLSVDEDHLIFQLKTYTVSGVPSAATYPRGTVYVSNESGGAVPAFSDGTNWRRVTDRAIIS